MPLAMQPKYQSGDTYKHSHAESDIQPKRNKEHFDCVLLAILDGSKWTFPKTTSFRSIRILTEPDDEQLLNEKLNRRTMVLSGFVS